MKSNLFLLAAACLLVACSANKTKTDEKGVNAEAITLQDSTELYTLTASYPVSDLDTAKKMEEFVNYVVSDQKEAWKAGGEIYNAEMEMRKKYTERSNLRYAFAMNYKEFKSAKHKTKSYLFNTYKFEGGANGPTTVNTFTFGDNKRPREITDLLNIDNKNAIMLSNVLAEKALKEIPSLDKELLYNGLGLSFLKGDGVTLDKEKCNCDGYFFGSNLQNFVVKDSTLNFYFNQGQIAPRSFGIVEIALDWDSLKPYLVPNAF